MERNILCKCKCGGDVVEFDALYECKKCNSQVWKYSYKREFKESEAKKLFRGETIMLKGFRSNDNNLYDTKAKMENKNVRLIFDTDTKSTVMFKCRCGGEKNIRIGR